MNKPLLLILVLIAGGLVVYMVTREKPDTTPDGPVAVAQKNASYLGLAELGTKTDEKPTFDVTVKAFKRGQQQKLTFTIKETHGWGVEGIIVEAYRSKIDQESGERVREPNSKVEFMLSKPLKFGEELVGTTTLTPVEVNYLGGDVGESEDWVGQIQSHMDVYKPKS